MIDKTVYHGDESSNVNHDLVFFSTDRNFSSDYGDVKPYRLTLKNPFHTSEKESITNLINHVGVLVDSYDNAEYRSYEELDDSGLLYADSWEIFERHIDSIRSLGYDGVILYEGGIENYLSFDSSQYTLIN